LLTSFHQGVECEPAQQDRGDADNIITTYSFNNNIGLQGLKEKNMQGSWKLKVSDIAGQDIGKLNKWRLKIVPE